jgi:hypothetical protein
MLGGGVGSLTGLSLGLKGVEGLEFNPG